MDDTFIILGIVLILFFLFVYWLYKSKRVTSVKDLPSDYIGKELCGIATFIFDGDGFKFYHVPCCRSSHYTSEDKKLSIRLAGIDAPESAAFGKPGQPFNIKSKHELMNLILGKNIKIKLLGIDRYNRVLAMCYVEDSSVNVNLKMVQLGMACVYIGNDAVYDNHENELHRLEANAKQQKLGIWSQENYVSPMDYKKMNRKN